MKKIIFDNKLFLNIIAVLLLFTSISLSAPGKTEIISINNAGKNGNNDSEYPAISADGRFIVFHSSATNLVSNSESQSIYLYDRIKKNIKKIDSGNFPSISSDGRFIAYNKAGISVYDRLKKTTKIVANGNYPSISFDGRFIAFQSTATNLVPNDTNNKKDIFVYDRQNKTIERVSVSNNGTQSDNDSYATSISADGRFVTFESEASNLVPNDTNNKCDIFVYDRQNETIERVSISNNGTQGNSDSRISSISGNGQFVAFYSSSSNLLSENTIFENVFVYNRLSKTIEMVSIADNGSKANHNSYSPKISTDGRFVTFHSLASNLTPNDTNNTFDIFVYDRKNKHIEKVSVNNSGEEGDDKSLRTSISSNGQFVAFDSKAENLVPHDNNGFSDVFMHELQVTSNSPAPTSQHLYQYSSVSMPVKNSNPEFAYPFAIGDLASGKLSLQIGLSEFSAPVDIYLVIKYSGMPDDLFFIDSYGKLQKNKIFPWKTYQTTSINSDLFGDVKTSLLPKGTYVLYTLVVPSGVKSLNKSYLWLTSFKIETNAILNNVGD